MPRVCLEGIWAQGKEVVLWKTLMVRGVQMTQLNCGKPGRRRGVNPELSRGITYPIRPHNGIPKKELQMVSGARMSGTTLLRNTATWLDGWMDGNVKVASYLTVTL